VEEEKEILLLFERNNSLEVSNDGLGILGALALATKIASEDLALLDGLECCLKIPFFFSESRQKKKKRNICLPFQCGRRAR